MKRILTTIFAIAMLLMLSACKENTEPKNPDTTISFQSTEDIKTQDTFEELESAITYEVKNTVDFLNAEFDKLVTDITTYNLYQDNIDKIEEYYQTIYENTKILCIKMREYSINYAELIIASDKSSDDKYDDLEKIYDYIYDDAGDDIYDEIYDNILDNMYDTFYDELLDDAYDEISYKEWSDARSDEYKRWSGIRSDVYEEWSDFRSDVYGFWSDLRSELWSDDIDRAEDKIEDFQKDIDKLKNKDSKDDNQEPQKAENTDSSDSSKELTSSIRPEFKETIDSYEAFFDKYVAFMKKFSESENTLDMLTDYAKFMEQFTETMDAMSKLGEEEMSTEETKYYLEAMTRINNKLLDVAV